MTEGSGLHVLVIDDNQIDVDLLRAYLCEPGLPCRFTRAGTLGAGLAALAAGAVTAVVLDLTLPDAHGIDAVLRLLATAPDVPIVVVTSLEDRATAMRALQSGAQDYLVLGEITPPLLARALRFAIERGRAEAAKQREHAHARAVELREQFIAILSHDLKGPLTSIAMNASLLLEKAELSDRQLKTVARISRSAERMNRMIRDLLDFTRTRLGEGFEIVRAPCGLVDVCRQVLDEIETAHPDRTVTFEAVGRAWGSWDADRLAQAISNLIGNGLQYSPRDTPVSVSIGDDRGEVVIEVTSRGDPMPPDLLAVIFDPYFRAGGSNGAGPNQGLGLGLYIANQIVLAHGGRIDVTSPAGGGSSFKVRLPRGETSIGAAR